MRGLPYRPGFREEVIDALITCRRRWEKWQAVRAWLSVATLAGLIGAALAVSTC